MNPRTAETVWIAITITIDLIAIIAATVAGYLLRFHSGLFPFEYLHPIANYGGGLALQLVIIPIVFAVSSLYVPARSISWLDQTYLIASSVSIALAVTTAINALILQDFGSSRLMIGFVWFLTILFVLFGRLIIYSIRSNLRRRGVGEERVLIVGAGNAARIIVDRIRRAPETGYRPVGFISEESDPDSSVGLPRLGAISTILPVIREHRIDEVIIAIPTMSHLQLLELIEQCSGARVSIKVFPDLFEVMASGVNISELNGLPLISVKDIALRGWNLAIKRGMDLFVSASCLVLLSPLLLLIALAVKITSPRGEVFYVQERVGLDGKPFLTYKFRTMKPDAESDTGPVWASRDDQRRTPIGSFLRRFSLDEMPQLINVLLNEMSMVGPRPERPVFVEQFRQTIPRYFERHQEKAGLTGWAQVNGLRGNTPIEERTTYDLWYVENWTIWLDIRILLRTLWVVMSGNNAY